MKKTFFTYLTIVFSLLFLGTGCNNREAGKTIHIGAILPLTGDLASYGVDTKKALELAVSKVNLNGGINGKKVVLNIEDSKGTAKNATTDAHILINIDHVKGILGPITSPEVLAVAPIANSQKIPIISPSATSIDIKNAGEYVFRTINADNIETAAFAKFIKEKFGCMKIGIIADGAAGTLSYANSFDKYYTELGCPIIIKEIFQENTTDFRTFILKLLKQNINGIYVSGVSTEIGEIVRQIRQYDKKIQIFSYQSAEDRRVVQIAGDAVNDMYYSSTTLPEKYLGKARVNFVNEFKNIFGYKPGIFAAEIFDGANILMDAISKAEQNKSKMIDFLKDTKGYKGASGVITFDKYGDVHKGIAIYRYNKTMREPLFVVENGKVIPYQK